MQKNAIYVESLIDTTVDEVWARTQEPAVHKRWDVRFTDIDYLPLVEGEPQRFVYATTVAPGITIGGCGETLGERHRADGTAYSGLTFWSDHPISLIKEGAGYWRYVPTENGVRFLTRYDYRVRWGAFGQLVDRLIFRPVFGWGTAWSFDRLRLWIEKGITPERSRNYSITYVATLLTVLSLSASHLIANGPTTPNTTLSLAISGLVAAALLLRRDLPSGRRPLRQPATRRPTTTRIQVQQKAALS